MIIYEVICDLSGKYYEFTNKKKALAALKEIDKGFIIKFDTKNDTQDIIESK